VLAACLYWIGAQDEVSDDQLAQLFSRIRFPDIPASTLLSYHRMLPVLQRFDPDKELLLRAVSQWLLHSVCTWPQDRPVLSGAYGIGCALLYFVHAIIAAAVCARGPPHDIHTVLM